MRHLRHILYSLAAGLLTLSCVDERLSSDNALEHQSGDKVTIRFSVDVPELASSGPWTKSLGEVPQVEHLYVAVFDKGDRLSQAVVEAIPGTVQRPGEVFEPDTGDSNCTEFFVELDFVADEIRYLDFIAVGQEMSELLTANNMSEPALMQSLLVSGNVDAYWCRREVIGISESTSSELVRMPMVRNFCKVSIKDSEEAGEDHFKIEGFKVFNTPTTGTVVPFNASTPPYTYDNEGVIDGPNLDRYAHYETLSGEADAYAALTGTGTGRQGYTGFMPVPYSYETYSAYDGYAGGYQIDGTGDADLGFWLEDGSADYLYECSHFASDINPFIIIKAKYRSNPATSWDSISDYTYYKADFVYKSEGVNTFYHLLRNFHYELNIARVYGEGACSVYEAVHGIAMNNFEASATAESLTNVSDGTSRMWISSSDILINTEATTFDLYVKSRTGTNFATNNSSSITIKEISPCTGGLKPDDVIFTTDKSELSGSTITRDGDTWMKYTIPVIADKNNMRVGMIWKQTITFQNYEGLTRSCQVTFRNKMTLTVDVQDYVESIPGADCQVNFSIPAGLTQGRFPLVFYIEQEAYNLYPKALAEGEREALSVVTDKSRIAGHTSENTYYFKRTISWDEYKDIEADINGIRTFPSYLQTLKGASATKIWVWPDEANDFFDYFVQYDASTSVYTNWDTFVNGRMAPDITFESGIVTLNMTSVTSAVNKVITASKGALSYTSSDPMVVSVTSSGVLSSVGTGTATITVSCAQEGLYEAGSNTYTVNVVSGDLPGLKLTWDREQDKIVAAGGTLAGNTASAKIGAAEYSVTYESKNTSVATVNASTGQVTGVSAGTAVIVARASATVDGVTQSQEIQYVVTVVESKAPSGFVYHNETFQDLDRGLGDYQYIETSNLSSNPSVFWFYANADGSVIYGASASAGDGDAYYHISDVKLSSRSIDLSTATKPLLSFEHDGNYFDNSITMSQYCKAQVSTDAGSTWSDVQITRYPVGQGYAGYVKAVINLSAYAGQSDVRIAFHYTSDSTAEGGSANLTGTWQIKNVTIVED